MLQKLKNLIQRLKKYFSKDEIRKLYNPPVNKKDAMEEAKIKAYKKRVVEAYDRAMELEVSVTNKLNSLLSEYFDNFFVYQEGNPDRYKKLNKEWKDYCYNINRSKKKVPLTINAFEREVEIIISKNPQFKSNKI